MKLIRTNTCPEDGSILYAFRCPACGHAHGFTVGGTNPHGQPRWTFNGNFEKPTFTPSLRCMDQRPGAKDWFTSCHLVLTDGMIAYCGDCPHAFAGKTVPMVPFDD